jgi:hypothetical protein
MGLPSREFCQRRVLARQSLTERLDSSSRSGMRRALAAAIRGLLTDEVHWGAQSEAWRRKSTAACSTLARKRLSSKTHTHA